MSTTENCLVEEIYSSPLDALQDEEEPIYQTLDEAKYHRRSIKFDTPISHSSSSSSSFNEIETSIVFFVIKILENIC